MQYETESFREGYSVPRASKMGLFVEIVDSWNQLIKSNCVLNTPLALDVNEVCFGEEPISPIRMKNQQKLKALLNGTDEVNVEQCAKN